MRVQHSSKRTNKVCALNVLKNRPIYVFPASRSVSYLAYRPSGHAATFHPIETLHVGLLLPRYILSRPNYFQRSSRNRVNLLAYKRKPTEKREQNDWRAEKIWTGYNTLDMALVILSTRKESSKTKDLCCLSKWYVVAWSSRSATRQKCFSAIQSYCSRLSVGLLSCDSRSTPWWLDRGKKSGREGPANCAV